MEHGCTLERHRSPSFRLKKRGALSMNMRDMFLAQPFASRLARPQNLHSKAMSFIHQLSRATAQAQRAYDVQTESLVQAFVATQKEKFMEACQEEAGKRKNSCCINAKLTEEIRTRDGKVAVSVEQKLQAMLVELGFHDGTVRWYAKTKHWDAHFDLTATWPVADATSSKEPSPERAVGTCVTCPICQEHRPAVVLIPCGHVVCRDCQRCQQFRQCPMCRRSVSSASDGLFMDWAAGWWSTLGWKLQAWWLWSSFVFRRGPNSCIQEVACS